MGLRIALTSEHSWPGVVRGAERYVHELSAALADAGHDVQVVSTGAPRRDRQLGVPVRRVRAAGGALTRQQAAFGAQCLALLGGRRLDVWHATSTGDAVAAVTAARLRPGLRTVFTDHGFPVRRSREARGDARAHAAVVRGVGAYVCVSRAAGAWLERDYGRAAAVVPPGVDTRAFTPGPGRSAAPTVLYSGDLAESRKGVPALVEAVGRLPGVRLMLAGPGRPALDGLTTDHVDLLGPVRPADMPALYRAAWVTALPSTAESFGMALAESLACGTPGLARAGGGGPAELLTAATGVLAGDAPGDLAAALEQALALDAADACRARAMDFDWRLAVVPALEGVYA